MYSAFTRAIRIMCSTTLRLSVNWTPAAYFSSGEPGGAIRYGITYMVLPAEAPRISPVSFAFISAAGRQLLYTPLSAGSLVATIVRSSERAVSL